MEAPVIPYREPRLHQSQQHEMWLTLGPLRNDLETRRAFMGASLLPGSGQVREEDEGGDQGNNADVSPVRVLPLSLRVLAAMRVTAGAAFEQTSKDEELSVSAGRNLSIDAAEYSVIALSRVMSPSSIMSVATLPKFVLIFAIIRSTWLSAKKIL